jgi:hypothetical protein
MQQVFVSAFFFLLLSVGMVLRNTLANVVYKVVVGILSYKFYFLGEIGLLKLRMPTKERKSPTPWVPRFIQQFLY